MAFYFSKTSRSKLDTVHPALVSVMEMALDTGIVDFTITCGARSRIEQDHLVATGKSKLNYPCSKHNVGPDAGRSLSAAVDVVPLVFGKPSWDAKVCAFLAGIVMTVAQRMQVKVRWGGNWDQDSDVILDQSFNDLVHFELVNQ